MDIKIETMTGSHLQSILPIEEKLFSEPWKEEFFKYEIEQGDSLVALIDGILVGYVCGFSVLDEYSISNVGVSKDYQRNGIAFKLLKHLMDKKIKEGIVVFYLEVRESNLSAINLYRKLGFRTIGKRMKYYTSPIEDAVVMKYEFQ